jgi:hypothetical protein
MSKYFTKSDIDSIVRSAEEELDRREHEARLNEGIARLEAYMAAHPEEVANDPMVKALRAIPTQGAGASAQHSAPAQS